MKSSLLLTSTAGMSNEEWLRFRKRGIGASEVGTVMGLNPYKSSIELFYDKIGEELGYNVENMAMFLGKEQEPLLADMWQYWGGSPESLIKNYREGKIVRKCARVNAYIQNPDYPWLFVSLDRRIVKASTHTEGALELKTIAGYESDKWEAGIPPSHVVQVQTQCLVPCFDYGELATLKNGREFDVVPFKYNANICQGIVDRTQKFWQRVVRAREVATARYEATRNFNQKLVDECNAELQSIEPEPDGSESFANFLKEKYRIARPGEQMGTLAELAIARKHMDLKNRITELQNDMRLQENTLKMSLRDGADRLEWGKDGYITWKTDVNGVRRFVNKVKGK
jgi:putative phage-type endonuclease